MVSAKILTEHDQIAVRDAVKAAERQTSGEIVAMVTLQSDEYLATTWGGAALGAFAAVIAAHLAWPTFDLNTLMGIFLTGGLIGTFLFETAGLSARWAPLKIQRKAVQNLAREYFFQMGLHATEHRAAILILISMRERRVEIIADTGIDKKVTAETWNDLAAGISQGMKKDGPGIVLSRAIQECGQLLKTHFPFDREDPNTFPDEIISI